MSDEDRRRLARAARTGDEVARRELAADTLRRSGDVVAAFARELGSRLSRANGKRRQYYLVDAIDLAHAVVDLVQKRRTRSFGDFQWIWLDGIDCGSRPQIPDWGPEKTNVTTASGKSVDLPRLPPTVYRTFALLVRHGDEVTIEVSAGSWNSGCAFSDEKGSVDAHGTPEAHARWFERQHGGVRAPLEIVEAWAEDRIG